MRLPSFARVAGIALCVALPVLLFLSISTATTRAQTSTQQPGEPDALAKLHYPRTIVLVRHAEKGSDDARDPSLSEAGVERAKLLAKMLAHAGVTHLFASEFKRTRQTLAPLSLAASIEVQVVPAGDPKAMLSTLDDLPRDAVAVVAGHSNTLPALLAGLGVEARELQSGANGPTLAETEFDRLFVVTQWGGTRGSRLLELRYGN